MNQLDTKPKGFPDKLGLVVRGVEVSLDYKNNTLDMPDVVPEHIRRGVHRYLKTEGFIIESKGE
ncbi:hypothetical protein CMI37_11840 [Candidatus Pacearchaeota archaeon]|nr:hypothetical protein [Candidatus Pacearchaeota archaeon]